MSLSRRGFGRLIAGGSALAAVGQLGRASSVAQTVPDYRAMVGVFLFGGNDGWNTVVPTDARYAAYASTRGASLALPQAKLLPIAGGMGLHPSLAPLMGAWNEGAMGVVLNTGSLYRPLNRAMYLSNPELRPLNLMSHTDEQLHWQGMRVRSPNLDGYMGRLADKTPATPIPSLISIAGSNVITIGQSSSPLVLPSNGTIVRNGFASTTSDAAVLARQAAFDAFADGSAGGSVTDVTAKTIGGAYAQAVTANAIISATTSTVDAYFKNPATGAALTSDVSRQLLRAARMIEARGVLGQNRQVFFVGQGGYDTHSNQVDAADTTTGNQANLLSDLAMALAGFYNAMKALGVAGKVTAFTMSDFGRVYRGNAQRGSDHAWGNNHLVLGGALKPKQVLGRYPDQVLGGAEDANTDGRWIPSTAAEEYIGAIASWYGVPAADMSYVFPNWATWSTAGRGAIPLFT